MSNKFACPLEFSTYKVIDILNQGLFSTVAKVRNAKNNKISACKFIDRSFFTNNGLLYLLDSELRILERVDHVNIAKLQDVIYLEDSIAILVEYCDNGTLYSLISMQGPLDEMLVLSFVKQILSALEFLHSRNISHRDLKLENIVFDKDFVPKLIDFGLSSIDDNCKNILHDTICGTAEYLSPQIVKEEKYDPKKADIWALGICTYCMITGSYPWRLSDKHLKDKIISDNIQIPDTVSPKIASLIKMMLTLNEQKRPSASKLLEFLSNKPIVAHKSVKIYKTKIIKPLKVRHLGMESSKSRLILTYPRL